MLLFSVHFLCRKKAEAQKGASKGWFGMKRVQFVTGACAALLAFSTLTACESKMAEKQAVGYSDSTTVDAKVAAQNELDARVNRLQDYVDRARNMISTIQTAIHSQDITVLSSFDIVAQINTSLQSQLSQLRNEKLFETGQIRLDTSILSDDCKVFNYVLSAESLNPLEKLSYSLRSCYTQGETVPVLEADFVGNDVNLEFYSENLKKVLPPEAWQPKVSNCQFSQDATKPSVCQNIFIGESKNLTWTADLVSQGVTQIKFQALSKKTGAVVYDGSVTLSASGALIGSNFEGPLAAVE